MASLTLDQKVPFSSVKGMKWSEMCHIRFVHLSEKEKEKRKIWLAGWLVVFVVYGPSTHFRPFRARSVNLATLFPRQASNAVYQYLVPFLSPVTDNCPSWISGRVRMVVEMFLWPNLNENKMAGPGLKPATPWFAVRLSSDWLSRPAKKKKKKSGARIRVGLNQMTRR